MNSIENLETPVSDRGVETPNVPRDRNIQVVFDWFQCTIMHVGVDSVLERVFHITCEACEHLETGLYGYNNTYVYADKIKILWHKTRSEMGVHIQISGSACRILEDLISWKDFFNRIMSFDVWKVTRIDVAIDTFDEYFTIQGLKSKIVAGELCSKFKKSTYMEQFNISDGSSESASITFGSMSSDMYIVFYDKLAERRNAGFDINVDFWIRSELRFKGNLAMELMKLIIINDYFIGDYIQKILYNYIDFKDLGKDTHKDRWITCKWWLDFLGVVSKLSIAPKSQDTTITKKKRYAEHMLCKLFAMVRLTDNDFYNDLFRNGFKKIGKADLDIINAHFIGTGQDVVTMEDLNVMYNDILSIERESYMENEKAKQIIKQIRCVAMGTEYEAFV